MLNQYLRDLGFSEKEIVIYLAILENGKLSAGQIARITKINRTTVYSVSKDLMKKGLITEDIGGVNAYYLALPLEDLQNIYKEEEKEIKKKKEIVEKLIPELNALPKSKGYSVPKIRFIDERHLRDFLFKELAVWIKSAKNGDQNWWGFQDASFITDYPDWFKYHWEIFPADYGTRIFTNQKPEEEEFAKKINDTERRQVKYWAKSKDFTATHAVLGDYVLFCVTSTHPNYLVEIHDVVMAENLRELFKGIWEKI